ncbi:MAG TPA: WD40 repeat domain-containing protein [Gemmataceae bacterium]|nr:WD40 repeat domain-containing protein [Gemmataceae bacterium]
MPRFLLAYGALLGAVAFPIGVLGQKPAEKDKPKPATTVIKPEPLTLKPGDAMSAHALVTKPPIVKGVVSWTLETRRHRGTFSAVALSPDGKLIATGGLDGTIRIWDAVNGHLVKALVGHGYHCYGLAFSPDGNTLASGGINDQAVHLWDVKSGMPLKLLKGHPSYVSVLGWSPNGREILGAGGNSGFVSHWDANSGKILNSSDMGRPVQSISWHPNGREAAITAQTLPVQILGVEAGRIIRTLGELKSDFTTALWAPDGKTLAAGTGDKTILFDDEGKMLRTIDGPVTAFAWTSDSKLLAVSSLKTGKVQVFDPESAKAAQSFTAGAYALIFFPDDKRLLGIDGYNLNIYDVPAGKTQVGYPIAGTTSAWWTANRPLIVGLGANPLTLWDPATGKLQHALEGHASAVSSFAWSPDGKLLATSSYDQTVRVWDANGKVLQVLEGHKAPVTCVAWSTDGKQLASGDTAKTVLVWNASGGPPTQMLKGHGEQITRLAFAPGPSGLLATSSDKTIKLWDYKSGKLDKTLTDPGIYYIQALCWDAEGRHVLSGDSDGRVRMWVVSSGRLANTLDIVGATTLLATLAIAQVDRNLINGKGHQTVLAWPTKNNVVVGLMPSVMNYQSGWPMGNGSLVATGSDRTTYCYDGATGQLRGYLITEEKQIIAISVDGNYRADGPGLAELLCVVQLEKSQETLNPTQFSTKYKWKNVPANVKLLGK